MVKLIKKILVEINNEFFNEKKVITIGKEDRQNNRDIHYISNVYGNSRLGKKHRAKKSEVENLMSRASNIRTLKVYS